MMYRFSHKGFTLIEVILVIALVGVLGTALIVLINPGQQFKRARDVERKSDIRQIQSALELYRADNSAYPAALPNCDAPFTGTNGATYLQKLPCDPKNTTTKYQYTLNGNTYTLIACLEDTINQSGLGTQGCASDRVPFTVNNP